MSTVDEFRIEDLHENSIIFIIGEESEARARLTKSILKRYENKRKVIICPTVDLAEFYTFDLLNVELHKDYVSVNQIITNLLENQIKRDINVNIENVTLFFDECVINSELLQELIYNGLYYKITLILTMQTCNGIKLPSLKQNFDYLFILRKDESEQRNLWSTYINVNLCFEEFFKLGLEAINDGYAMVIYNASSFDRILKVDLHKDIGN